MTLRELQDEQAPWVTYNFPGRDPYYHLLGAMEELGELAHAHLKGLQGIRHTPAAILAMKTDAIGDIVIYLADYCTANGIDFQNAVTMTWQQVKQRDWQQHKQTGVPAPAGAADAIHYPDCPRTPCTCATLERR